MMPHSTRPHRALVLAAALVCACGGGSGGSSPGPRREMLQQLAAEVIVPAYRQLADQAAALGAAAEGLRDAPSPATLTAAQEAWRATRQAWKRTAAFEIGPAAELRTAAKIDWSPIRGDRIEREIDGTEPLTAAHIEDLGANVKGLLALEYLLFDPAGDETALDALSAHPRRRAYVAALAGNLVEQVRQLRDAWEPDAGNFSAELVMAGQGSATYATLKSAVDELVNHMIFLSEDVADAQLLAPLGARTGGTPRPDLIAAHRSQSGLADVRDGLASIALLYLGGDQPATHGGFSAVVNELNPTTDGAIASSLIRAARAAGEIPAPLEVAVTTDPEEVSRAQQHTKTVMRHLEIDLIAVLGTTLRFNPSDGD